MPHHKLQPDEIEKISNSVSLVDYFFHLERMGRVKFDRKTGHDHYFLTENNKFSVTDTGYYDFKSGKGGKIIKAVMDLENKSWKEAIDFLKEFGNTHIERKVAENKINTSQHNTENPVNKITKITTPNNDKLFEYFAERGISKDILQQHTQQVHYIGKDKNGNDKEYFGIGLKNQAGGYDVRNPFQKTKIAPSDISVIQGKRNETVVFEGMTDMFSFLQLCKDNNVVNDRTLVVLNSISNIKRFVDKFKDYQGKIHLILDGDKGGNEATEKILTEMQGKNITDSRKKYQIEENGNGDLNDYLKNKIKNNTIQEKNTIFTQENKSLNNSEYEQVTTKSSGISTSEPVGRKSSESDNRKSDQRSQSKQEGDNTSGLEVDSKNVGNGLSESERDNLGREQQPTGGVRASVPSQRQDDENTQTLRTGEHHGVEKNVTNGNDANDSRGNQTEFEIHQHSTTTSTEERERIGENSDIGNRPRGEGIGTDSLSRPFGLANLEANKIIKGQKPTNDAISQLVDVLTSVSEKGEILLKDNVEITDEIKDFVGAYKSGGITKDNRGILDEYYTDEKLVVAIHNLIKDKFDGKTSINVLEPSVGTGNFLHAVKDLGIKTNITAFEINDTTAKITKILHPDVNVNLRSFETEFITDNGQKKFPERKYDLVIGNPPYGAHRGFYKGLGEEHKIARYEDYFVKRSLDVLKDGGTLAMVLPSGWLNRQKNSKGVLLTDAYRLPNGVFKGTDIGTDIIVLKSNVRAFESRDLSKYFEINKDKILGEIGQKTNRFGRQEDYIKGNLESALEKLEAFNINHFNISVPKEIPKQGTQLSLFDNFGQVEAVAEKEIKPPETPTENNENEINIAILKLTEAMSVLEKIKFKSLAVVEQIKKYTDLRADLYNKPQDFNKESLLEIIQKAENIIKLQKDKKKLSEEYAVQVKPEIKKNVLKYHFTKQDEIVETGLQNSPKITKEQLEAFRDTKYNGELTNVEKHAKYANFMGNKWIHDFYYAEGDIYEKLERLEWDYAEEKNRITPRQYEKQKALLESVLPKPKTLDEIIIAPNHEFIRQFPLGKEEKNVSVSKGFDFVRGRPKYEMVKQMVDVSLAEKFKDFLRNLPNEAFGNSSSWEVIEYVNNVIVTGSDKERNALVRERRKEVGNELFNKFIREELSDDVREKFVNSFNRKYNNIHIPDYSQFPLFSKIHQNFKGEPLNLTEVQKAGIGRLTTKGVGLLAHEVGFGKTLSGVLSMHEAMERGNAKRPLIVVPNDSILKQWVDTIFETIPDARVNVLGNLGKDYDLSKFDNKDGEITLVTYEGFNNIGFSNDIVNEMANKFSYISAKDMSTLDTVEERIREIEIGIAKEQEMQGKMKRGKVYDWEDFGFDHLTFDEVHNANHIVSKVRIDDRKFASDFKNQQQRSSKLGLNTWVAAQYIQEQNNGRNVTILSATPFTNKPLEYYSVLSLVANERLEKSGYFNINNFFETFMEADNDMELDAKGDVKFKMNVRRFKNNALFQQLLGEFIDIKGEEDNPELKRPNRINKEYKIEQNKLTIDEYNKLNAFFDESKDGAILSHILNARLIAFSPYLSKNYKGEKPTNQQFIENSPKLKTTMDLISQNKKDKPEAGQIIYSELGIAEFPKLKEYLVNQVGYKPNEVELITGATSKAKRQDIQEKFNKGDIKVIIGSEAIQEGMNLQENTTDMYLLSLPYNFTSLRQTEGRAWRQGNKWENVRINFMLTNDSIDVFMLQKLQAKQNRYMEAIKKGASIVDVSDVDTQELKTAIITSPETRANIEIELLKKKYQAEKSRYNSDIGFISRKFEDYNKEKKKFDEIEAEYLKIKKWAKDEEGEGKNKYWTNHLPIVEEKRNNAKQRLDFFIKESISKGIDIRGFMNQQAISEKKIEALNQKINNLDEDRKLLIEQYKKEKEEKSKNVVIDFVKERGEENKTFFKLTSTKEVAEKKEINQEQKRGFKR